MRMMGGKRGQSIAEYAIVFSVVAAAVIGMQVFVKRGLQAKSKNAMDAFSATSGAIQGDGGVVGGNVGTMQQYEPYYATSAYTVTQDSDTKDVVGRGSTVTRTITKDETKRTGSSTTATDVAKDDSWK